MAYLVPADFRTATLNEACIGRALSTNEASDAQLTAAIADRSLQFDQWTDDTYSPTSLTFNLAGDGTSRLELPKRCTALTTVTTIDLTGATTVQSSSRYRLVSSLDTTGSYVVDDWLRDFIAVIPGNVLQNVPNYVMPNEWPFFPTSAWPTMANSIQVAGTFGWTNTPGDVKRAISILVYEDLKPRGRDQLRATTYQTADAAYSFATTQPTGIPLVDEIITRYARNVSRVA